jgi:hypothetical protein
VNGSKKSVEYAVARNGSATFNFVSQQGTTTESYTPRQNGGGAGNGRRNAEPPPGQDRPPRGDQPVNERGAQRQGGGGDPIFRALDANGDGAIDKAELVDAVTSLRVLDKNKDGQITSDELRGPGGEGRAPQGNGRQENAPPDQAGGPRQPWILVHADEIDLDRDKIISRDEIVGEATKAFAGYDANNDNKLTEAELSGRGGSRSAMGGFLKGHSKEIDRDGDGILTREEAVGNAERMFGKMDLNGDGNITPDEMEKSRRK